MTPDAVASWVRDGMLLGAILALGLLIAGWFRGSLGVLSRAGLAFPLGSGLLTMALFLASWSGIPLDPIHVLLVTIVCLLIAGVALLLARRRGTDSGIAPAKEAGKKAAAPRYWVIAGLAGIGLMGLVAAILGVGHSYSAWDDMAIWSLKGYGIALEGTIFAAAKWGAHGLDYPLNVPLQIALFRIIGGDALPESKILFPLTYVSLLIGCLGFWLDQGVRERVAVGGSALMASVPAIFLQATIGYANLHLTTYLVLGTLQAISGITRGNKRQQALAGLLLGLAAWTRPEGMLLTAVVIATLILLHWATRKGHIRYQPLLAPLALIVVPWQLFSRAYVPESEGQQALVAALRSILAGHPALSAIPLILRWNLRLAMTPSIWGMLIPVSVLLIAIGAIRLRGRWPYPGLQTLAVAVTVAAAEVFYWYITYFRGEIASWKDFDFYRHFAPAAVLLGIAGVLAGAQALRAQAAGRLVESGQDRGPQEPSNSEKSPAFG